MDKRQEYRRLRRFGWKPAQAWRAAETMVQFERAEDAGLVRLLVEPEHESYFDVYGEPDGYVDQYGRRHSAEDERREIIELIESEGCWYVASEVLCPCCHQWTIVEGVGMIIADLPQDPARNVYAPELMRSALDELIRNGNAPAWLEPEEV